MRARAILLTGAPGTGKSTLGRTLAVELRLPFIARDDIRGGLAMSAGAWTDTMDVVPTGDDAVEVFLHTVEGLLSNGVSCLAEYVVRSHRPADLERLRAAGDVVAIVTTCTDPEARLTDRNAADRFIANPAVLRAAGVDTVGAHTAAMLERMRAVAQEMQEDLPVHVLKVDTTDGLEPALDAIVEFATAPLP